MEYKQLKDEELVKIANSDDEEALDYIIHKYKTKVKEISRSYFLIGGDMDDLIQEGMIGLYKAIREYDPNKNDTFLYFASMCIRRQLYTAIKRYQSGKNKILNSSLSLENKALEDFSLIDIISDKHVDPEEIYIYNEEIENKKKKALGMMSDLEKKVFELYIEGYSYRDIALMIDKTEKSINNTVQRIRKKIKRGAYEVSDGSNGKS